MYPKGTIINMALVILGSLIGLIFKKAIPERIKSTLIHCLALATFSIGLLGVVTASCTVDKNALISNYSILMVICLVIGTLIGEFINIEKRLDNMAQFFQKKFSSQDSSIAQGFVTSSLVFCVGSMSILGSLNDGITGDCTILVTKSLLDGVVSIIFASTLGIGVMFSALTVGIYQGLITVCASFISPFLTQEVISQMSFIGSILIMGIGLNFLYKPPIKLGNMLPAMFMPLIFHVVSSLFEGVF